MAQGLALTGWEFAWGVGLIVAQFAIVYGGLKLVEWINRRHRGRTTR